MHTAIRNLVGIMIIIGIPLYAASQLWQAHNESPTSLRQFNVSAEGESDASPDLATLYFTVVSEGGTNAETTQKENTTKMNNVLAFVKRSGVEDKDITTQNYSISPRYEYYDCRPTPLEATMESSEGALPEPIKEIEDLTTSVCPPPSIVGYTVRQTASVKVRDFDAIGDIITGATAQGANSISGPSFTVEDQTVYENEARDKAIAQARQKAESIANASGVTLGKLLSINESVYADNYYGYGKGGVAYEAAPSASTPDIEAGTQKVTVNVNLVYEIK